MRLALLRALVLFVVPLAAVGPSLVPGKRFLPITPAAFEPLAGEAPEASARGWQGADRTSVDALFPLFDDQRAMAARLANGELPLWDAQLGAGAPLFAGSMAGPLSPLCWPRLLLDEGRGHAWSVLAALTLAGLGMLLFLRRRGFARGPAWVGVLALQAGGFALSNLHLAPKFEAALWLPFALWSVDGLLQRERLSGLCLSGSIACSWLAGFPGIAAFVLATSATYALVRSASTRAGPTPTVRTLSFLMLGVALAAVQWIPMVLASAQSLRAPQSADAIARQALPLATGAGLLLPNLFGAPDTDVPASRDGLTWWLSRAGDLERTQGANALEWNLFAGLALLVLAMVALAADPRRARVPALMALAAIAFAQGWPLVSTLYHLPGLALGAPSRVLCVAWFAWAWLAAVGTDALLASRPRALGVALGACLTLGGLAFLAWLGFDAQAWAEDLPARLAARFGATPEEVARQVALEELGASASRWSTALRSVAFAALALALALLASRALGRGSWRAASWAPIAGIVVLEGLSAAGGHLVPRTLGAQERLLPESAAMQALAHATGDGRVLRLDASDSGLDDVLVLARPNLPRAYGIGDLTPYVVFPTQRVVELLESIDPRSRYRTGASRLSDPALLDHPVLDLLRVTAVLTRAPCEHPALTLVHQSEGFHVYRRSGALAAVRVVPAVIETPTEETALGLLAGRAVDPRRMTVLAPGQVSRSAPASGTWQAGELRVQRPRPERFEIDVSGSSGGWLVVGESWAPGWRAWIDGREVEVARVDHALQGLPLPAGDAHVVLRYAPSSLRTGLLISLVALAGVLFRTRWRRSPAA